MSKLEHRAAACREGELSCAVSEVQLWLLAQNPNKIIKQTMGQNQGQRHMENKAADVTSANRCIFTHHT